MLPLSDLLHLNILINSQQAKLLASAIIIFIHYLDLGPEVTLYIASYFQKH